MSKSPISKLGCRFPNTAWFKMGRMSRLIFPAALFVLAALPPLVARDHPPDVPPPKPVVLPMPTVEVLPNGLKVVVIERHALPVLTLRLVVKAGAESDPAQFPGAAGLVAGLLDEGTAHRTAQQIAQAIDDVGGTMDTGSDWDNSFGQVSVLTDHSELAFDLLADIIIHPAFAPAEVERIRKQALSALEIMRQDPAYLADAVFSRVELGGTAYGHPADGTIESVRKVSARELRDFHARYYLPSNAILAVVGDIKPEEAFRQARKFFGDWPSPAKIVSPKSDPAGEAAVTKPGASSLSLESALRQVVVIDKPDAVQTEIRIGNLGIPRDGLDYYSLTVANQILGGPSTNRLFKALRSQRGLTYGASSDLICLATAGIWRAKTSTRTSETMKSVQLVLEQMKHLRDHAISSWELEATKSYLTGHMALDFETSEGIAEHVLDLLIHNLPLDYWNRFPERIQGLTTEQVWNATREHLDPDRALIVLVGSAAGFEKDLKKLGPVRVIPVGSVDLGSKNLEKQ
jgi:zinc protease